MRNVIGTTEGLAAAGYAAFSLAMVAGRFAGDWLAARFDPVKLVRASGVLAAGGLLLALIRPDPAAILAGFACVGAGFSIVVPMVVRAAGRIAGIAPGVALASVTTMGYFGFLAGPPSIGFAAELLGLRYALAILTSLVISALAPGLHATGRTVRESHRARDRAIPRA